MPSVDVVRSASKRIGGVAGAVAKSVSTASSKAASSKAAKMAMCVAESVGSTASETAMTIAKKSADTASEVLSVADSGLKAVKESTFSSRLKKARIKGFRDGIKQGAYLAGEKRHNFLYAYVATLCYFLRCDGEFSNDEQAWLCDGLKFLKLDGGLPEEVNARIMAIADDESIAFDDVKDYLDKVSIVSLESIAEQIQVAVEVDGEISKEEQRANLLFADYLSVRMTCVSADENRINEAIEKSVREYRENLERIDREFRDRTKLQDADVAFLFGATMLQLIRVLVINYLTEVECAGNANRNEKFLHGLQGRVFEGFNHEGSMKSGHLYASKQHILVSRGVPYDATRYAEENLKLFKGANHRFATLGHDPVLGLIFGTANIMTNSITCVKNQSILGVGMKLPITYSVGYDAMGKNPCICSPVSTVDMLIHAGRRVVDEPTAAGAALIKQLIHIGTDMYTPCGIQIPLANLMLDKGHVEKLTKYASTGDVLKVGTQAGMAVLINWLVAALHGCSLAFNGEESRFAIEMYQARTKKIILMSNAIATSSSIIQAAITSNLKCIDLGGAAVLAYRLFTDVKFIAKLKEEYLDSELGSIYDERAEGLI